MRVLKFSFQGYRNLHEGTLLPHAGTNVIFGKNAQGKTNLLEAMWLFTGGHSFRGAKDAELVGFGEPSCSLQMDFFSQEREQFAKLSLQNGRRQVELNGVKKRSAASLVGKFCAVVFSPAHLSLVKDGPAARRGFLDGALCQSRPAYAKEFFLYQRTLQQRNALLKDIPRHRELFSTLEIWDEKIARCGADLIWQRQEYLQRLSAAAQEAYRGISKQKETLGIAYQSSLGKHVDAMERSGIQALFWEKLESSRTADVALGYTSCGPHRDDMELMLDGVSARSFGSQGQQRSIVLALKLAEAELLCAVTGEQPVVFLDDVMSELDAGRQEYILHCLDGRQVFLTCCDPRTIRDFQKGGLFHIENGAVIF